MTAVYIPPDTNPVPHTYTPRGWDAGWKTAKASGTPFWIAFLGESTMIDQTAVNSLTIGWPGLLRTHLLTKFPLWGDSWGPGWNANKSVVPAVYTSSPNVDTTDGQGLCGLTLDTLAHSPSLTIAPPLAYTDFDLLYDNAASGSFAYAVDGGADHTINLGSTQAIGKTTTALRGLANTTHTIVAHNQSADSRNRVAGINCYPTGAIARNTGIGFGFYNIPGHTTKMYRTVIGSTSIGQGVPQAWAGQYTLTGFPVQPHLTFIMTGINDCSVGNVDPMRHYYTLDVLIQSLRAGQPNAAIVLVTASNPNTIVSGVSSPGFTDHESWYEFSRAQHTLARIHNCAWVNIHGRWSQQGVANGFYVSPGAGNAHPSTLGHADIYNAVLPLL